MKYFILSIGLGLAGVASATTNCIYDDNGNVLQCIEPVIVKIERELRDIGTQSVEVCASDNTNKCFIAYETKNSRVANLIVDSKDLHRFKSLGPLTKDTKITALSTNQYNQVNVFTKDQYWLGDDPEVDRAWLRCGLAMSFGCGGSIFTVNPILAFGACLYAAVECSDATRKMIEFQERKRREEEAEKQKQKDSGRNPGGGEGGVVESNHPPESSKNDPVPGGNSDKKPVVTIIEHPESAK